jgi:hypothetical protein
VPEYLSWKALSNIIAEQNFRREVTGQEKKKQLL